MKVGLHLMYGEDVRFLSHCLASASQLCDSATILNTAGVNTAGVLNEEGKLLPDSPIPHTIEFNHRWTDHFAEMRNYGLDRMPNDVDWVLHLDADERLVVLNKEHIIKYLREAPPEVGCINLTMVGPHARYMSIKTIEQFPSARLFRLRDDVRFIGRVHENISASVHAAGLIYAEMDMQDAWIAHIGYDISKEKMAHKTIRNMRLMEQQIKEEPNNGVVLHYMAKGFAMMGLLNMTERCCIKAIGSNTLGPGMTRDTMRILEECNSAKVLSKKGIK